MGAEVVFADCRPGNARLGSTTTAAEGRQRKLSPGRLAFSYIFDWAMDWPPSL